MAPLAAHFAAERPVVLLDQRAHGRSGDADAPLSYPWLGDDAARVVAALGAELGVPHADVLGYSMGGAALQLAIRHPARVCNSSSSRPRTAATAGTRRSWTRSAG